VRSLHGCFDPIEEREHIAADAPGMRAPPLAIEGQGERLQCSPRICGKSAPVEIDGTAEPLAHGFLVETPDGFGFVVHADLALPRMVTWSMVATRRPSTRICLVGGQSSAV
jgi:hypothetical protein